MEDELAKLRERDVDDDWCRGALPVAPLINGAIAVLIVRHINDSGTGNGNGTLSSVGPPSAEPLGGVKEMIRVGFFTNRSDIADSCQTGS